MARRTPAADRTTAALLDGFLREVHRSLHDMNPLGSAISTNEIAKTVGVSPSQIWRLIPGGKPALKEAAWERAWDIVASELKDAMFSCYGQPAEDTLLSHFGTMFTELESFDPELEAGTMGDALGYIATVFRRPELLGDSRSIADLPNPQSKRDLTSTWLRMLAVAKEENALAADPHELLDRLLIAFSFVVLKVITFGKESRAGESVLTVESLISAFGELLRSNPSELRSAAELR